MTTTTQPTATQLADINWSRYQYCLDRGHRDYIRRAQRCNDFYLGAGKQWSDEDKQRLKDSGNRPWYELNLVMPGVNSAIGYQIHNRMDITFRPRGQEGDELQAALRSKIAMQVCDHTHFHWKETQVFADGLIEQRGYFDIRMDFDQNVFGDISVETLDPRDVIPDPDAKGYDPSSWYDVTVTLWFTADQVAEYLGEEARQKLMEAHAYDSEADFGDDDDEGKRAKFGSRTSTQFWDRWTDEEGTRRYRLIMRQYWKYQRTKVVVFPTGEVEPVDYATPDQIQEWVTQGATPSVRMRRVVQWCITSRWATLFDQTSPYDRFTVVPFFCYFRRGETRGMVDNAISPQEVLNKAISQFVHIVNTTANSGWTVEENSLVSHTVEDLEDVGSKTGIVIVYKQGAQKPEKIMANQAPQGMDRLIEHAFNALKEVTVPDAMRGTQGREVSGIAIQSKQFASQQQLAVPLDNLSRTRRMVADFFHYLMTRFMDNKRVFRITETDPRTGKKVDKTYTVNEYSPEEGRWKNDLTAGDYDTVVTEQPMQVTFENSQFQQALEMRKVGVRVPDNVMIRHSNLLEKSDIIEQMAASPTQVDPLTQAKAALAQAQGALAQVTADKIKAETVNERVTSMFAAAQTGATIASMPAVSGIADGLLKSAGFEDQDAAPIIPAAPAGLLPAPAEPQVIEQNTSPLVPAKPESANVGITSGIEGGGTPPPPAPPA
jgi:hypothetical protein